MRIVKVVATDTQTNDKQVFTFGTAADGRDAVTTRGGKLFGYLQYCFEQSDNARDVETEFFVNDDRYLLCRLHNDDGTMRSVLKKFDDGRWQVVARAHAIEYVQSAIGADISSLLAASYVNNKTVESFHGELGAFDEIRVLCDVQAGILRTGEEARELKNSAMQRLREYAAEATSVSSENLDEVNSQLNTVVRDITVATAQLGELKAMQNVDTIRADITSQLNDAQTAYNKLLSGQQDVEDARQKVKLRDDIAVLIPKVRTLKSLAEQRDSHEKRRFEITGELEWQQKELDSIRVQLEEKDKQYALTQDKRNRIDAINGELSYIASLYEQNKKLNEELTDLTEKQQRLESERAQYMNKLQQVEQSINEVRKSLDAFSIPARSVGELLEAVRIDVKIDEVNTQIEKLQTEIAVKENQIAERESNLVTQIKRFRAVAELDVAVTPIKAKDTILQVLDTKYSKLDAVNTSLAEKKRNLERALEDYKFRLSQLGPSLSCLQGNLEKTLLRKQEEFKREVYLNSQKVFTEDATGVFAVTANFHDADVEQIKQEIAARNLDRDLLLERINGLKGALKEIERHFEINSAEMETLNREKKNILDRYEQIVAQNTNETVFNYVKALSNDNGTRYLLDVQQDAVRSEAELGDLKRATESSRAKLTALKNRLKYLRETQSQIGDVALSVESLVSTNDRLKDELTGIGERFEAGYEQYKSVTRQIENIESRLDDVNAAIVEKSKTVKVNEQQIAVSTAKAQSYAGSEDLEQAVVNLRYELGDVESERQMLRESRQTAENEVFAKRLELEKTQWLYDNASKDYRELYVELQTEFNIRGLNIDKIISMDVDGDVENLRKLIAEFDARRAGLAEKIQNYYSLLANSPAPAVSAEDISDKEKQIQSLVERRNELEKQRGVQLEGYVAASAARARVGAAAAEAKTLNSLKQTIAQNQIVSLLVQDKIKSMLFVATQYLNAFTGGGCRLLQNDLTVSVCKNGKITSYDELSPELKTAVYVSLLLSISGGDSSEGKLIVFEERINVDRQRLSAMLRSVNDVYYQVGFDAE